MGKALEVMECMGQWVKVLLATPVSSIKITSHSCSTSYELPVTMSVKAGALPPIQDTKMEFLAPCIGNLGSEQEERNVDPCGPWGLGCRSTVTLKTLGTEYQEFRAKVSCNFLLQLILPRSLNNLQEQTILGYFGYKSTW